MDIEEENVFNEEEEIWSDLERMTGIVVDLVVFNRASSTICASVYLEGIPLVIKDQLLYGQHFNIVTDIAEEYHVCLDRGSEA